MKHGTKTSDEKRRAPLEPSASQAFDPMVGDPNELRHRVCQAFLKLGKDERVMMRNQLLAELNQAGVKISNVLFALGITAETPDALMPSDLAHLVRYLRINSPDQMRAVAGLLTQLLSANHQKGRASQLAA